jgi:tellurite resistance protein TehA-like permease
VQRLKAHQIFSLKFTITLLRTVRQVFFIIAGVIGICVLAFFILKIAKKYEKEDEKNGKNSVRPISHRHHHHRVIKKSA